jgi:hypothetical protein
MNCPPHLVQAQINRSGAARTASQRTGTGAQIGGSVRVYHLAFGYRL